MTAVEFISSMRDRGAIVYDAPMPRDIELCNISLQTRRCAMLPAIIKELYTHSGGLNMDSGYIFGPNAIARTATYPIPGIVTVNDDMSNIAAARGKTIFGRNDLFLFAFDAFGVFYMLENLTLRILKKYDDGWQAMTDCLMGGRQ